MLNSMEEISLLTSSKFIKQKEYWTTKLTGEIKKPTTLLKIDETNNHNVQKRIKREDLFIHDNVEERLMKVTKKSGLSIYIILLAVTKTLIHRYTGSEDIVVVSPVYSKKTTDETLNDFVFIRDQLKGDMTIKELLFAVRKSTLEAYDNQDYPAQKFLEYLFKKKSIQGVHVLSDIACSFSSIHNHRGALDVEDMISFTFLLEDGKLRGHILYDANRYDELYTKQLSTHYLQALKYSIMNIDEEISTIPILLEEEKKRILLDFNHMEESKIPDSMVPEHFTLHQLFEEQVEKTPDYCAVIDEYQQLTYRELNKRSNQLADFLRCRGVKANSLVGMMAKPSIEMIIGIIGILKAGGAYLPIDLGYPAERIRFILEESRLKILLTQQELVNRVPFDGEIVNLNDEGNYRGEGGNPGKVNLSGDLIYIIYTSGTTGKPKGVLVEHRNVIGYLSAFFREFNVTASDTVIQQASYSFDAFVEEIYPALLQGGKVAIPRRDVVVDIDLLTEFIVRHGVNMISCSPLLLDELNRSTAIKNVHTFISGGDLLRREHVDKLVEFGNVYNTYGPTETTVCASYYRCPRDIKANVPMGTPIKNYMVYILDPVGRVMPVGLAGELCISGFGVARGYLNRQELTQEKFISNPFIPGEKMYKTGDLACWLPDGNLEFLGRIDGQIKLRGYRIELGEIENLLLLHHQVKEAVVVAKEDKEEDKYLCAYVMLKPEVEANYDSNMAGIRKYLSRKLPDYMIPSYFVAMEKFPLTLHGKIDRKVLPPPEIKASDEYIPPADAVEMKLVEIWSDVLAIKKDIISVNANFFELGGHSLKATILLSKIHKELDVKIPLTEMFEMPTIRGLVRFIKNASGDRFMSLETAEKKEYYRLSSAQKRLYVLQQMDTGNTGYNMSTAFIMEGKLDIRRFECTFEKLIRRHEILRTSFRLVAGHPVQKVHENVEFKIEYYNSGNKDEGTTGLVPQPGASTGVEGVINGFVRPFDLLQAPLLRIGVIKVGEEHIFMADMHHIVSDGISENILVNDFMALYKRKQLTAPRFQYKDFSEWQNRFLLSAKIKMQQEYWLKEFSHEIPVLDIPTDYKRQGIQTFEGSRLQFVLGKWEVGALKKLAGENGVTLYMALLAIFNLFIGRLCGVEDVIIGTPVAGRRHSDLEQVMGMFVNTLAVRNHPSGKKRFLEFLKEVKQNTLEAFENQEYQFEELVNQLPLTRDMSRNPLFDVMLVLQNSEREELEVPGLTLKPFGLNQNVSKFDMTVIGVEKADHLAFTLEYRSRLFIEETIKRFIKCFSHMVSMVLEDPSCRISEITIIGEEERREVLYEFNNTGREYPSTSTIKEIMENQVVKTPHRAAVVHRDEGLTYNRLNEKANQLAWVLRKKGVGADAIVGIMVERSIEMAVGILGILKAGGAYLPIDKDYPPRRIKYVLQDSGAGMLLTRPSVWEQMAEGGDYKEIMDIYDDNSYDKNKHNLELTTDASNLAYVIYTSGSTGRPKGVMVEQGNVLRLVKNNNFVQLGDNDKILQTGALEFDASTFEIWGALLNGLRLYLTDRDTILTPTKLKDMVQRFKISIMWVTSPLFNRLVEADIEIFSGLKTIIVGGDVISPLEINKVRKRFPRLDIINGYGPTENTTFSTTFLVDREYNESIPIGKPIANSCAYIVDHYNRLLPIGIWGELWVGGDGVSRGYLNNPELTAEKFIDSAREAGLSPPSSRSEWLYRTGDRVRWLSGGNIEFAGRIDQQVKVRGYRIELGEIENHLLTIDFVREAVVVVQQDHKEEKFLLGYIVVDQTVKGENFDPSVLKNTLSKNLPDYMIPSYFILMESIPLTPNGKVDRRALPAPQEPGMGKERVAPGNPMQQKLVEIWSRILGIKEDAIGIDSDFFDLGGHSLKATVLVSEVHKELDLKLSLTDVFTTPTIRELSESLKTLKKNQYREIPPAPDRAFYALSSAQKRMYVAQQLELQSTSYNMPTVVQLNGEIDNDRFEETLRNLIKRHDSLRTSFVIVEDEPVQKVHDFAEIKFFIEYYNAGNGQQSAGNGNGADLVWDSPVIENIINNFVRPFDLSHAPLLRVGLVRTGKETHLLMLDIHHIISDGVSQGIFIRDFASLYKGESLTPLNVRYIDYSEWQNQLVASGQLEKQEAYWSRVYKEEVPVMNLPTDFPRPDVRSNDAGDLLHFDLGKTLAQKLYNTAKENGATLFMVLLAIFKILLSKYGRKEDIVVGTPVTGRSHPGLENVMGVFINMLAIRSKPCRNKTFREFLSEVKQNALDAFENQDSPFDELINKLGIEREPGRNPLFDNEFSMNNLEMAEVDVPGLELKPYEKDIKFAKYDLHLLALEIPETIHMVLRYSVALFKKSTIKKIIAYYIEIAEKVVENVDIALKDIKISHKLLTTTSRFHEAKTSDFGL